MFEPTPWKASANTTAPLPRRDPGQGCGTTRPRRRCSGPLWAGCGRARPGERTAGLRTQEIVERFMEYIWREVEEGAGDALAKD